VRVILAIAAVLFGTLGIFALIHPPSDIQIIIRVQGLGFALTFAALFAVLGRLRRLEDATRTPVNVEWAGGDSAGDAAAQG
jgi:hypothetical protein